MGNEYVLKLSSLFKSYGNNDVLCGLNLTLNRGECVGVVGKNGTGKTTLLKIISDLLRHYYGYVDLRGNSVASLIDTPIFINDFTGRDNIEYMLDKQFRDRAIEIIKNMNMTNYLDKPVGKYSQGMRQKLAIAIVFATDPDIILLDEPFNSIDIDSSEYVIKLINEFKSKNKGIIVVTHNVTKIESYCDRILTLKNGVLNQFEKTLTDVQQYRFSFLSEQDAIMAQIELGEYTLDKESAKTLLVTFDSGNLPTIIKRLVHCNVTDVKEINLEITLNKCGDKDA
ncbi:MAG: ATP-binding cassette domain-containing protein [Christensenellaceae bacterium]|jgi:ABC-type multidrug transport system ATPase subunit|nr:ATP-binding cassette domain-containing protein [Christensenellaceae bacterium]